MRFHYRDWGGEDAPIVLPPGLASISHIWNLKAPLLSAHARVVARDQRGHGRGRFDMKVKELGHVVLYVRDLAPCVAFYRDLLGFEVVGEVFQGQAVAMTGGRTHHELLLIQVGAEAAPVPSGRRLGMYHFGLKIGDSLDELREAYRELVDAGATIVGASDHTITQSLYIKDPDGNEVELYVDADPAVWKDNPAAVLAPIKPLQL